jgi:uncharacterized protein (DUF2141 family)
MVRFGTSGRTCALAGHPAFMQIGHGSEMKSALLLPLALLAGTGSAAPAVPRALQGSGCQGPPSNVTLTVNVQGLRSGKGLIAVSLYADDKKKFLVKKGSIYVGRVDARAPATRLCMHLPAAGTYALAVYHDEDASRKLNRNFVGLPTEGFGFSNNPKTFMSLPAFSAVRLNVPRTGMETTITLRYP